MKKKIMILGLAVTCLLMPTSALAETEESGEVTNFVEHVEISPRITVSKFILLEQDYTSIAIVPQHIYYSYYDHDYSTTLKGTLTLYGTTNFFGFVRATYQGYCSGSI